MTGTKMLNQEPMLALYVYETGSQVERLEEIIIRMEARRRMAGEEIGESLNILHAIKSASAMMLYPATAKTAQALEGLFGCFREKTLPPDDYESLCELMLETVDFIKNEVRNAGDGLEAGKEPASLISRLQEAAARYGGWRADKEPEPAARQKYYITHAAYQEHSLRCYRARIQFEKNCQMENIRAFTVVHNLRENCRELYHRPSDLIRDLGSSEWIAQNGFNLYFTTELTEQEIRMAIEDAIMIEAYTLERVDSISAYTYDLSPAEPGVKARGEPAPPYFPQGHEYAEQQGGPAQTLPVWSDEAFIPHPQLRMLRDLVKAVSEAQAALSDRMAATVADEGAQKALLRLEALIRRLEEVLMSLSKTDTA